MSARSRQPLVAALVALLPVLLVAGIWLGGHPEHLPGFVRSGLVPDGDTRVIAEALDRIEHDYYRPVDRSRLINASIAGQVSILHDRFSNYFTPREFREFTQVTDAKFSGVGIQVTGEAAGLRVIEVYDRSPAARAGIRARDLITAADGRSLRGLSETNSSARIKGPPGTEVTLTVRRGASSRTVKVTRATVSIPVVASRLRTVRGIKLAQLALATFSSGAHGELRQAVQKELKAGARGIVLDLRHNGGGLVEEARLVASIFLPDGKIVTTRGRSEGASTLSATGGAISPRIGLVVLVDHETASASEIVAGALQDHHRATVVGAPTFGKGVFQEVRPLSNGGALDITVGQYFTPNGHNLGGNGVAEGAGITPDVSVRQGPSAGGDPALQAALRAVAAKVK